MTTVGLMKSWWRDESGQDMVEWALLIAFVTVAAAAVLSMNVEPIDSVWSNTKDQLENVSHSPRL